MSVENRNRAKSMKQRASSLKRSVNKPLARLTPPKKRVDKSPVSVMQWVITTNPTGIKKIIRECYKESYPHKYNLDKMGQFHKKYKLPQHALYKIELISILHNLLQKTEGNTLQFIL